MSWTYPMCRICALWKAKSWKDMAIWGSLQLTPLMFKHHLLASISKKYLRSCLFHSLRSTAAWTPCVDNVILSWPVRSAIYGWMNAIYSMHTFRDLHSDAILPSLALHTEVGGSSLGMGLCTCIHMWHRLIRRLDWAVNLVHLRSIKD